jgi:DNA-binding CsgD family transcriptional regulator
MTAHRLSWTARTMLNLGLRLGDRAQRQQARKPLALALDIAARCGATALADRARSELIATGARPRREMQSGPGALTPAERRTARMAAARLSNREIAQALFLSTKTIETQLSSAYTKLSIATRRELHNALEKREPSRRQAATPIRSPRTQRSTPIPDA